MANVVIILGPSGTGKSTSIKNLNPDETVIFNPVRSKKLPFKGCNKLYNKEKENFFLINNYFKLNKGLEYINTKGNVKNIIIDDCIYVMRKEYFDRAKEPGFNKFTDLAVHFQSVIETCEDLRPDLNVFLMLHSEQVQSDNAIAGYKVSTVGKLLDQQYNPVEVVSMVLFSAVRFEDNKPIYGFYTNAVMEKGAVIPAKSPEGMFDEEFIPNDLSLVCQKMDEYYN